MLSFQRTGGVSDTTKERPLKNRRTTSPGKMMVSGMVIIHPIEKGLLSVYDADVLKTVLLHLITPPCFGLRSAWWNMALHLFLGMLVKEIAIPHLH